MDREMLKIHEKEEVGTVHISNRVVAVIAGLAATEVEGVSGMVGNLTGDIGEMLGRKNLAKGVVVEVGDDSVSLSLQLSVDFGESIPAVTSKVQDKVKSAVETMTGLSVDEINIRIADVNLG